jgi:hypothetical protein
MVGDMLGQLPAERAQLADRRAVMREAATVIAELYEAVKRLGDVIAGAGLRGRAWRAPESNVRLLSSQLPDMTVNDLITCLAAFADGRGPEWLRGDAALETLQAETADLQGLLRSLGIAAQSMRAAPAHQCVLPIEVAFGSEQVVNSIEHISLALGDLSALAPFMGPLSAEDMESLAAASG